METKTTLHFRSYVPVVYSSLIALWGAMPCTKRYGSIFMVPLYGAGVVFASQQYGQPEVLLRTHIAHIHFKYIYIYIIHIQIYILYTYIYIYISYIYCIYIAATGTTPPHTAPRLTPVCAKRFHRHAPTTQPASNSTPRRTNFRAAFSPEGRGAGS